MKFYDDGNYHELAGDREGQLACVLSEGYYLVIRPNHDPLPLDADGNVDYSRVTAIEIQAIVDTRSEKLEWKEPLPVKNFFDLIFPQNRVE